MLKQLALYVCTTLAFPANSFTPVPPVSAVVSGSSRFSPVTPKPKKIEPTVASRGNIGLYLTPNDIDVSAINIPEMIVSRTAFWICLVAAGGTAQIGRTAIPVTWGKYQATQALAGLGSSLGGEDLGLAGYPDVVYKNDVVEVLNNIENMTIPAIVEKYPIQNQIEGYLRYESLVQANPNSNPLAVRAVFDSLALGINKNQVAPSVAIKRLQSYKQDLSSLSQELNKGRSVGILALLILLGLLGAADYFSLYHLFHAYFPLWPGVDNFPFSLLSVEKLSSIPDYFMADIPERVSDPSVYPV